jgi:tyrosine-protein phosphatase SIW14
MRLNRDFRQVGTCVVVLAWALSLAAADAPPAGLSHFAEVDEHVYRGGQPGAAGLKSLAKLGVKAVIDLRGDGERSISEQKEVEAHGMKYYSIPLPSLAAPTDVEVSTVLALIEDSQNWPVYVHCLRGKDRTGTVIACYRIRHDRWPNARAMKEAQEHGLSRVERGMRSFVLHYNPGVRTSILAEVSK